MPDDGRSIGTPREPISRGDTSLPTSPLPVRAPMLPRDIADRRIATAQEIAAYGQPVSADYIARINDLIRANAYKILDLPRAFTYSNQATTVSPSAPTNTFNGQQDPFTTLSDVFRNLFGSSGDVGQSKQVGQALVPVTSSSGGGNTMLLLVVVLIVGAVGYYYYKKRKQE